MSSWSLSLPEIAGIAALAMFSLWVYIADRRATAHKREADANARCARALRALQRRDEVG